jgi:hypothetical protein
MRSACASAESGRHGHLVAVEVGAEGVTDERADLDRLAPTSTAWKA